MIELSKLLYIIRYKGLQSIFSRIATLFLLTVEESPCHNYQFMIIINSIQLRNYVNIIQNKQNTSQTPVKWSKERFYIFP